MGRELRRRRQDLLRLSRQGRGDHPRPRQAQRFPSEQDHRDPPDDRSDDCDGILSLLPSPPPGRRGGSLQAGWWFAVHARRAAPPSAGNSRFSGKKTGYFVNSSLGCAAERPKRHDRSGVYTQTPVARRRPANREFIRGNREQNRLNRETIGNRERQRTKRSDRARGARGRRSSAPCRSRPVSPSPRRLPAPLTS